MFRGRHTATVDAKGRLKMPTEFKAVLEQNFGPEVFVTSLDGASARVYPFSEWRKIEDKLLVMSKMDPLRRKFLDGANYWGQTARMDPQGRMLVPVTLRDAAGLQGKVDVLGNLEYIAVWNPDRLKDHIAGNPITPADEQALSDHRV
jgi:MraZ protein